MKRFTTILTLVGALAVVGLGNVNAADGHRGNGYGNSGHGGHANNSHGYSNNHGRGNQGYGSHHGYGGGYGHSGYGHGGYGNYGSNHYGHGYGHGIRIGTPNFGVWIGH